MELIDSKEDIKNSKLLWLIIGVFSIPTFNAFNGLIEGLLKVLGVSIIPRLVLSVSLDGLIVVSFLSILIWIIKNWNNENTLTAKFITLKHFRKYGFICLFIIIAGRTSNYFLLTSLDKEIDLLDNSQRHEIRDEAVYLQLTDAILRQIRELTILIIYFVIVFKNKQSGSSVVAETSAH